MRKFDVITGSAGNRRGALLSVHPPDRVATVHPTPRALGCLLPGFCYRGEPASPSPRAIGAYLQACAIDSERCMSDLIALWLPILASAVFVFLASSLIHMVFRWHQSDYRRLGNEDAIAEAIRAGGHGPGQYVLPYCQDMQAMQDPDFIARHERGPVGFLRLSPPGKPNIGPYLLKWFLLSLGISVGAALAVVVSVGIAAGGAAAAPLVAIVCFLAYGAGSVSAGIWKAQPWASVSKDLLDAAIYAGVSALAFWWLMP